MHSSGAVMYVGLLSPLGPRALLLPDGAAPMGAAARTRSGRRGVGYGRV